MKTKCCQEWEKAEIGGTDNEGYGRLISVRHGEFVIGCRLRSVSFCPWCGTDKRKSDPLTEAAKNVIESLSGDEEWTELTEAIELLGDVMDKMEKP